MYTLTINGEALDTFDKSNTSINWGVEDFAEAVTSKAHKTGRIRIPATPRNSEVLGRMRELNTDGYSRNTGVIEGNGVSFAGLVVVYPAVWDGNKWVYELQIISGNGDWVKSLESLTLQDLDLSAMDHVLNRANVIASHSGTLGYVYDLCDRGLFMDPDKITLLDRFPAVQISRIIRQIFTDQNINVQSNTLTSADFANKYLLFTRSDNVQSNQNYKRDWYFVRQSTTSPISQFFTQSTPTQILFFNGNTTTNGQILYSEVIRNDREYFNVTAGSYTVPADMVGAMKFRVISHWVIKRGINNEQTDTFFSTSGGVPSTAVVKTRIMKNGSELVSKSTTLTNDQSWGKNYSQTIETAYSNVAAGDVFKAEIQVIGYVTNYETINPRITFTYRNDDTLGRGIFRNFVSPWYAEGDTIEIGNCLPENMLQIDFIKMVTNIFDLLYSYNAEERKLTIEHRDKFYRTDTVNFGEIIDISSPITIEHTIQHENNVNRYSLMKDSEDKNQYQIRENTVIEEVSTNVFSGQAVKDTEFPVSDTISAKAPRIGFKSDEIPVLWESSYQVIDGVEVYPSFRTSFNMRIVSYLGYLPMTTGTGYNFDATYYTSYPKFEPFGISEILEWHNTRLKMLQDSKRITCKAFLSSQIITGINNASTGLDIRTPVVVKLPGIVNSIFVIEAIEGFTLERNAGVSIRLVELQGKPGGILPGTPGEPPPYELIINDDGDTLAYNDENDIIFAGETELTISET